MENVVWKEVKKHKWYIIWTMVIKFVGTITELVIPLLLSYIIDTIVPMNNIWLIILFGLIMVVSSAIALVTNIIANRMSSKSSTEITRQIRYDLFVKVAYLSEKQVDKITIPSLVSRMTSDTYNVHHMIGMIQRLGIRRPILFIGGIIFAFIISPTLAVILLFTLPFILWISIVVAKQGHPLYQDVQKKTDREVEIVRENIVGIRVVKALSKKDYEIDRFDEANLATTKAQKKASFTMSRVNPLISLILNLGLVAVILMGAYLVKNGYILPGKILSFNIIFGYIIGSVLMITRIFMMISRSSASIKRIQEVMELEDELKVIECEKLDTNEYIVFDNVSFSYNGIKNDLENISLSLKKGESLGILGSTGSGKTTLINLLLRLYDPTEGNIYLDKKNIKSIDTKEFREKFGVVFQNDIVFGDSLKTNIDFYRNLEEEKLHKAVFDAQAKFINNYEEGLEHVVASRGIDLSGGQRQRLLLARSMAAHPDILILDDSSSALDYKTDAAIRKTINEEYSDTTLVVIAQRISSVMNCSKIIILENGKISDMGTHEELLEKSHTYQEIAKLQMGVAHE